MKKFLSDLLRRVGLVRLSEYEESQAHLAQANARFSEVARQHADTMSSIRRAFAAEEMRHAETARSLRSALEELRSIRRSTPAELHVALKGAEGACAYLQDRLHDLEERLHRPFKGIKWDMAERSEVSFDAMTYRLSMTPLCFMVTGRDHFGTTDEQKREAAWRHAWTVAKGFEKDILRMLGVSA